MCDHIQVRVEVTAGADLALSGYTGLWTHFVQEHRNRHLWVPGTGFPGAQTLPIGVGGGEWDHWGVWACVKALDAQSVYVQKSLNRTGMCKRETERFPGPALVHGQTIQHLCWGKECLSCAPEHAPYRGTAPRCIALFTVKREERCAQVDIFTTLSKLARST